MYGFFELLIDFIINIFWSANPVRSMELVVIILLSDSVVFIFDITHFIQLSI